MTNRSPKILFFHLGGKHLKIQHENYFEDRGPDDLGLETKFKDNKIEMFQLNSDKEINVNITILIVEDEMTDLVRILNSTLISRLDSPVIGICSDENTFKMLIDTIKIGPKIVTLDFSLSKETHSIKNTESLYDILKKKNEWKNTLVIGMTNYSRHEISDDIATKMTINGDTIYQKCEKIYSALDEILFDKVDKQRLLAEISSKDNVLKTIAKEQITKHHKDTDMKSVFSSKSEIFREAVNYAQIASNTDETVIIYGETGSGKQIFAEEIIHKMSKRRKKKFLRINCAASPANLKETMFFGYKKGAFTGADTDRIGYFEAAEGGTLFLDEIGNMPLTLQDILLDVIEMKQIIRVGETEEIDIDVRIIVATNKNLKNEVIKGDFKRDFYHRLARLEVKVPPLREHKQDIELLLEHFAESKSKTLEIFSKNAIKEFYKYDYPGNIRELKNMVIELLIFHQDKDIIDSNRVKSIIEKRSETDFSKRASEEVFLPLTEVDNNNMSIKKTDLNPIIRKLDDIEKYKSEDRTNKEIGVLLFPKCKSSRNRVSQWLRNKSTIDTINDTVGANKRWPKIISWYKYHKGKNCPAIVKSERL